jgi:geranylgeranyl diphosphate synthase, type I
VPPRNVVRALAAFCEAHRDVVFGQQLDLVGSDGSVEVKHALKTASYTTRGPLLVGANLAGASDQTLEALERFAHPLGVAFQLRDDLLGVFAPTAKTGKPLGGDLREGKHTAVTVAGEQRLDTPGRAAYRRVFGNRRARKADLVVAAEHLERCGARREVQRRVKALCRKAAGVAARLPVHRRAQQQLVDAVALVAREVPFSPSISEASAATR